MNIVYSSSDSYAAVAGVSLYSLMVNNSDCDELRIFIIDNHISEKNKEKLTSMCRQFGRDVTFIPIADIEKLVGTSIDVGRWNISTFARLFYGSLLPKSVDKVIHVDCDTMVMDSLKPLWDMDLSGKAVALLLLLIVLFPLGGNCVFLLSNGLKHTLMIYSFVFFDVWALMLCDIARENKESQAESSTASVSESKVSLKEYVVPVLCGMLILNRVLFANALYLNVDLLNRATLSFMTRMVDRMERTPGYKIGETPVIIVGHIRENPYVRPLKDFGRLHSDFLGGHGLDVTFPETYKNYFDYVLNYPVQYVPREEMAECLENLDLEAIHNMPIFPEQGGVALIDGVLVVKLSENIEVTEDADW